MCNSKMRSNIRCRYDAPAPVGCTGIAPPTAVAPLDFYDDPYLGEKKASRCTEPLSLVVGLSPPAHFCRCCCCSPEPKVPGDTWRTGSTRTARPDIDRPQRLADLAPIVCENSRRSSFSQVKANE